EVEIIVVLLSLCVLRSAAARPPHRRRSARLYSAPLGKNPVIKKLIISVEYQQSVFSRRQPSGKFRRCALNGRQPRSEKTLIKGGRAQIQHGACIGVLRSDSDLRVRRHGKEQ